MCKGPGVIGNVVIGRNLKRKKKKANGGMGVSEEEEYSMSGNMMNLER